jgi:dihydroxyacetone kinase
MNSIDQLVSSVEAINERLAIIEAQDKEAEELISQANDDIATRKKEKETLTAQKTMFELFFSAIDDIKTEFTSTLVQLEEAAESEEEKHRIISIAEESGFTIKNDDDEAANEEEETPISATG